MWINRNKKRIPIAIFRLGLGLLTSYSAIAADQGGLASLGQALFFDTNLSANRTQACATCHDPERAFIDGRDNGVSGAFSLGDDGFSLGDRNTPTATYAFLIPDFHIDDKGEFIGGYFHDGRAETIVDQAGQPFTNPIEMAMPDNAAVVARVRENPSYVAAFKSLYGTYIFSNTENAFRAITESLVAFENTRLFAPFDSKYDRYLRGEYQMTGEEELGRILFFSQLINCSSCHILNTLEVSTRETFSNHQYHNIGVPSNIKARQKNGVDATHRDLGLLENPAVDDPAQAGKFRVPNLRNIAVTGPYMHNGVFQELLTAILFYGKFTLSDQQSQTNPETGEPWGEAEVTETVSLELLRQGQPLTRSRAEALAAFLTTLTDQRYESLLVQTPLKN
jgi:cytochrome c peroxidase